MKWLLAVVLAVVLLIVGIGFAIPGRWQVAQTVEVAVDAGAVYGLVADLRQWPNWTEWNTRSDPGVKWSYAGASSGAGATAEWNGPQMGHGVVRITDAEAGKRIAFDIVFQSHEPSRGSITVTPGGAGCTVTWSMEGDAGANPIMHLFVPMTKAALAEELQENLTRLAQLARSGGTVQGSH
jgi:hypothetical protein